MINLPNGQEKGDQVYKERKDQSEKAKEKKHEGYIVEIF